MSRINTNVSSMISQRILRQNNSQLNTSLERLSTGLAINRGADNPAGLIASENLRSEKVSLDTAINNAERADQVINIAEGGLQEVSSMLLEVQSLVGQTANDAGLSREEKEANQLQIDSILQTIDRIASSTSFQGTKLLNGSFSFTVSAQDADVNTFQINAAKLGYQGTRDIQVVVTESAQHAGLFLSTNGPLDLSAADAKFSFEIAGVKGSREFSFASGTTLSSIADSINTYRNVTGVSAVVSATGIALKSIDYGSEAFVSFNLVNRGGLTGALFTMSSIDENVADTASEADLANVNNAIRDDGQDIGAIINGITATSKGRTASVATDFLDLSIELSETGAQAAGTIDAFTITGGGARFNLGPNVDINNQVSIGIQNVAARYLGDTSIGFLDDLGSGRGSNLVTGDLEIAQQIVTIAISQVSSLRGRLGAFQKNVIGSTINSLGVTLENTSAAESAIRDTDFASETANLTRAQILSQSATSVLKISNSMPQSALSLLQ
ncbi:MAG: flagellin [Phycisphaeraceae bacterium]|nr:flagellin [Phycisphaeraceae bacterium]